MRFAGRGGLPGATGSSWASPKLASSLPHGAGQASNKACSRVPEFTTLAVAPGRVSESSVAHSRSGMRVQCCWVRADCAAHMYMHALAAEEASEFEFVHSPGSGIPCARSACQRAYWAHAGPQLRTLRRRAPITLRCGASIGQGCRQAQTQQGKQTRRSGRCDVYAM